MQENSCYKSFIIYCNKCMWELLFLLLYAYSYHCLLFKLVCSDKFNEMVIIWYFLLKSQLRKRRDEELGCIKISEIEEEHKPYLSSFSFQPHWLGETELAIHLVQLQLCRLASIWCFNYEKIGIKATSCGVSTVGA